jgi:hypothetical protein
MIHLGTAAIRDPPSTAQTAPVRNVLWALSKTHNNIRQLRYICKSLHSTIGTWPLEVTQARLGIS